MVHTIIVRLVLTSVGPRRGSICRVLFRQDCALVDLRAISALSVDRWSQGSISVDHVDLQSQRGVDLDWGIGSTWLLAFDDNS